MVLHAKLAKEALRSQLFVGLRALKATNLGVKFFNFFFFSIIVFKIHHHLSLKRHPFGLEPSIFDLRSIDKELQFLRVAILFTLMEHFHLLLVLVCIVKRLLVLSIVFRCVVSAFELVSKNQFRIIKRPHCNVRQNALEHGVVVSLLRLDLTIIKVGNQLFHFKCESCIFAVKYNLLVFVNDLVFLDHWHRSSQNALSHLRASSRLAILVEFFINRHRLRQSYPKLKGSIKFHLLEGEVCIDLGRIFDITTPIISHREIFRAFI